MRRIARSSLVVGVSFVALALGGVPAGATKVGPRQPFVGRVNGSFSNATVRVICPGPATGKGGHPASGQSVEAIFPPPVRAGVKVSVGNTGGRANRIVARFSDAAATPITITQLGVDVSIPTSLILPCSGKAKVVFRPAPASKSSRSSIVTVHFVNPAA